MPLGIQVSLLMLISLVAVPAGLSGYSWYAKRRHPRDSDERRAALAWVGKIQAFWFPISPFLLIAGAGLAFLIAMRSG